MKNSLIISTLLAMLTLLSLVIVLPSMYSETGRVSEAGHVGTVGQINRSVFNPAAFLTTWNFNDLSPKERIKYYREKRLPDGTFLREYWIYAKDQNVEVAPGVFYSAWTYNGQVPGPTIRAIEGDTIRIYFTNSGSHPGHSIGFRVYDS